MITIKTIIVLFYFGVSEVICDYKSSLTFAIDDTSSMHDDIVQVKMDVNAIFDTVLNSVGTQIGDFVLVTFNDPGTELRAITKDRAEFRRALSLIHVHGGGDCPELSMSGIIEGIKNSKPGSTLYVFTDASAKDHYMYDDVKFLAIKKQIQVVFVLTGLCTLDLNDPHYAVYKKLAKDTDGEIFHLRKSHISEILKYVKENIKGRRTLLASGDFPPGNTLQFNITKHTKNPIILTTGDKHDITVKKPNGDEAETEPIFAIDFAKAIKILNPEPGTHTVEVPSAPDIHVSVTVQSDIKFQHGFSTFEPSSVEDTTLMPLPDVKSHITIKLTDGDLDLKTVQILDMDGNLIKETTLKLVNKMDKLYTTDLEDLPEKMFKIAIVGLDSESEYIKKVGLPIATQRRPNPAKIMSKSPSAVILGPATQKVKWNGTLQLKCKVEGYPKPNLVWVNKETNEKVYTPVIPVELPDNFISIVDIYNVLDDTSYACEVDNSHGSDSASVAVEITDKPYFNIVEKPKDTSINYLNEGELKCLVDAYPLAQVTWYKNSKNKPKNGNVELSDDKSVLKIKEMTSNDEGVYICEVKNQYNTQIFTAKVTLAGAEPPIIDKRVEEMVATFGTDVVITCNILKGSPKPSILWEFIDEYSGEQLELDEWDNQQNMHIKYVDKEYSGRYSCTAKNDFGSDSHEISLTVEYPVKIKEDQTEYIVAEGQSIFIPCIVEGNPEPSVIWSKKGLPLSPDSNLFIYKDHSIRLTASIKDSGTYNCVATNKFGTVSRVVKVDVYVPVTIALPDETKMEVLEGSSRDLQCQAKGHPVPITEWVFQSFPPTVYEKLLISEGASVLNMINIKTNQAGFYTCIATNEKSSTNISYEINVLSPPKIKRTYINKVFKAVERDVALEIKCEASGNPPPVITWLNNRRVIASGLMELNLVMRNVSKTDSGFYSCEARNKVGVDEDVIQIIVDKAPQPGPPTSTIVIGDSSTADVICDLPHKPTDQLLWYKNGALIQSGELTITNAKATDSGLYTCRVSNSAESVSGNTMVTIKMKPTFVRDEDEYIDFDDGSSRVLSCEANGDPEPQFRWWHNGVIMDTKEDFLYLEMEVGNQGLYKCEAQNEYGSVIRNFNVSSSACFLDVNHLSKLQPLMLSPDLEWPRFVVQNGYMSIPKNTYVYLFCPNRFKAFPNRYNIAFCVGGSNFKVQGQTIEFSDIECTEEMQHFIESNGETCLNDNTVKLKVVFKVPSLNIEAYEVCYDRVRNQPLYTKMVMTSSAANFDNTKEEFTDAEAFGLDFDEAYKCSRQTRVTLNRRDGCCFGRKMLVSPKDLFPGVAQKSTYSYQNVIPQWSTCNAHNNNWNEVERRVRELSKSSYSDLVVYTGVAEELTLKQGRMPPKKIFIGDQFGNQQPVPKYLWKTVQDPSTNSSLVIIQVNVPDVSRDAATYVRCRDICSTTEWMKNSDWYDTSRGFTYCCTLKDFEDTFNYKGVFRPCYNVLSDVSLLPINSLVV